MSEPFHIHRGLGQSGCVAAGVWWGVPAVLKVLPALAPWTDPLSPFYGAAGLVPPFRSAIDQEALAYSLVHPRLVLARGSGPDGTWLVLGNAGSSPSSVDGNDLAIALLGEVARCHHAGLVHNDIRPANLVESDAGYTLIDFDISCILGTGPVGRLGTRAFAAPELNAGWCSAQSDLFAVGRTLSHLCPDLGQTVNTLLLELVRDDAADRPASANEALRALGVTCPSEDLADHPLTNHSAGSWHQTAWMEIALLEHGPHGAALIARHNAHDDRVLGLCAGRLLLHATQTDTPNAWRALAFLLDGLSTHSSMNEARIEACQHRIRNLESSSPTPRRDWHGVCAGTPPDLGASLRIINDTKTSIVGPSPHAKRTPDHACAFTRLVQRPSDAAAWATAVHQLMCQNQFDDALELLIRGERTEGVCPPRGEHHPYALSRCAIASPIP